MNTTKKGDLFENKAYDLIKAQIESGSLPIPINNYKIFKKKKYYSKKREKYIIFDLAIEIWAKDADKYSIVYLIECKDYSTKKVPIGDIELFSNRVNDVAELNGKAIFIAQSGFPKSAIKYASNTGMMLIEVTNETSKIIMHKKGSSEKIQDYDSLIYELISKSLTPEKIDGLKKLSSKDISNIVNKLLVKIDKDVLANYQNLQLDQIVNFFENKYNLQFEFGHNLSKMFGGNILGCFDSENNKILIDNSIIPTPKLSFVVAHEIGHFYLHRNIKINQELYNNYKDSEYDLFENKHKLINHKNWIEWQANCFASNFVLPEDSFKMKFMAYRESLGISKYQYIYLDNQPTNIADYKKTLKFLAHHFSTSMASVEIRLENLNMITRATSSNTSKNQIGKLIKNKFSTNT